MSKRITPKLLANQRGMDLDEVLVRLWDAGFEEIMNENSLIPSKKISLAKSVLGVHTMSQISKIHFWKNKMGMSDEEFDGLLKNLDIHVNSKMRKLPKGGIKKITKYASERGIVIFESSNNYDDTSECAIENNDFEIPLIGNEEEIFPITFKEVIDIHFCLARDFSNHSDPISPSGIKNIDLLHSAIFRQETSFGKILKYPTPQLAGAALCHSLTNNHAFHNGNKRTALVTLLVFLNNHNIIMTCKEDELFKFILKVAQHGLVPIGSHFDDREVAEMAKWINYNSRKIESGDRTISWRRLERILRNYGCEIEQVTGTKFNIYRNRPMRRYFNVIKEKLFTQVRIPVALGDVPVHTIKKIRKDLKLTDSEGIDSNYFYSFEPQKIDDFINTYRKTLYRLAKL